MGSIYYLNFSHHLENVLPYIPILHLTKYDSIRPDADCCAGFKEYTETMEYADMNKKQPKIVDALATAVFVMGEDGVGMIEMTALLPYRGAKRRRWARSAETQLGLLEGQFGQLIILK